MDFLYFVLLVGSLIFVHELGHFVAAKSFGVKVVTFSLGFGPSLLRIRGRETEFRLGVLPFGGFVKMLEASRTPHDILPEDRSRTFEAQAAYKRVVIMLAGPMMNLAFPVLLYSAVFYGEARTPAAVVGSVLPNKPADGKLLPGDRVVRVDEREVTTFSEVQKLVARSGGRALGFRVERDGKEVLLTLSPNLETETRELGIVEHAYRIGVSPAFAPPVIGVPRPDSPAYRAGLRTFDRIVSIQGRRVERFSEVVGALSSNRGDTAVITYMRPALVPDALGALGDLTVYEPGVATVTPLPRTVIVPDAKEGPLDPAGDVLERVGFESADLYVRSVPEGSSEWRAGLRPGDRIVSLDGVAQRAWSAFEGELIAGASRTRRLEWTRDGETMAGTLQLRRESWEDELGQRYDRYVFRTAHWSESVPGELVPIRFRLLHALARGFEETGRTLRFIGVGLVRILQGEVSLTAVGGPITMYDVAGQAGAKGPATFVWAMAVVSLNLGLVNLLPIPVLDGGHLLLLAIETVSRRKLSVRTREIASLVGMSMLMLLMLIAFKNDVSQRWDLIVDRARSVMGGG